MKRKICKKLVLSEVSTVDRGANQYADMILLKSQDKTGDIIKSNTSDQGDSQMNIEEIKKAQEALQAENEVLKAEVEKYKKESAKKQEDEELKAQSKDKEKDGNVMKALDDLKKSNEELAEMNKSLSRKIELQQEAIDLSNLAKQAQSDYPNIAGDDLMKAKMLKAIDGLPEDVKAFMTETLKSANTALGKNFTPVGVAKAAGNASIEEQLQTMAKNYASEHNVTFAKAYTEVLSTPEGRQLYGKMQMAPANTK